MAYIIKSPEGKEYNVHQLSYEYNIPYMTIVYRLRTGVTDFNQLISVPKKNIVKTDKYGDKTLKELSYLSGIDYHTLYSRYRSGITGDDILVNGTRRGFRLKKIVETK